MLKVRFLTEGGKTQGYGHLARCAALIGEFARSGCDTGMVVRGDETISTILGDGISYGISDWLSAAAPECDVLVIDSYSIGPGECVLFSKRAKLAVFFDDVNRISYPPGIVVNGALSAPTISYPQIPGLKYLLGPKYQLVRTEFLGGHNNKRLHADGSVLITFGGNDMRGMTPVVLGILSAKFPALKKVVVIGNSYDAKDRLETCADDRTTFVRAPSAKELARLMSEAGFAVCAGGQTLFELAASGTPAIVIGIADNQKENISGWSDTGFIDFAGWHDSPGLQQSLVETVKAILSSGELCRRRRKASGIINPGAARELVLEITGALKRSGE